MMLTTFHNRHKSQFFAEHRLCHFESPENAAEVSAVNRANLAPNATSLIEKYSAKEVASRFPFLKDPFHREMFFAFAMERDGFKDVRENGTAAPDVDVQLLTDYQKIITMVNNALKAKRISFRDFPEQESNTTTNKYLRRDEYLAIVARCLQNIGTPALVPYPPVGAPPPPAVPAFPTPAPSFPENGMQTIIDTIVTGNLQKTRDSIDALQATEPEYKKKVGKVSKLNNGLSIVSLQPNELLNRFNVFLGPRLFEAYINHIRGKLAPGSVNVPNDSAHTWTEHPERAFRFLHGRMMHTAVNDRFLDALNYWFVASAPLKENIKRKYGGKEPLDQDDTEAILDLIIKTLAQHEGVTTRSLQQQTDLKEQVGWEEKLEKGVADAWEYMKDFREHPVGAAAIAITGIFLAKYFYGRLTSDKASKADYLVMSGLGLLGLNAFMKHQTGSSILDRIKEKTGMSLFSSEVPLEQQTLPNYWVKVLNGDTEIQNNVLTENRKTACLTLLQDQRLSTVINWYEEMEAWRANGGRGSPPALPFQIQNRERFFGNVDRKDVTHYFHQTLHNFFFERGRSLPPSARTSSITGGSGYAARGLAYIRGKYMLTGIENVADNRIARFGDTITYKGKTLDLTKPASKEMLELRKKEPEVYRRLMLGRLIEKNFDWRNLKMYTVFLMEADPNGLSALGPLGTDAAGLVREIQKEVEEIEATV